MTNAIPSNLQSAKVFEYFEEISKIPRGSGDEKAISDFLVNFAKSHDLHYVQDENLNVVIKKNASPGYENSPTVVIQSHMDMVCEKNENVIHDFEKDPIKLIVSGDNLHADGTTLGADNGIGVAITLAILDSNSELHPPLEAVFTTDEERGMVGAMNLNPENIKGRIMINLDSSEEGVFTVGCAGGPLVKTRIPVVWSSPDQNLVPYEIGISGLKGGHSGEDIHRRRANANKLMAHILKGLGSCIELSIASIEGGMKYNAIPREAKCTILMKQQDYAKVLEKIQEQENTIKSEFKSSDPNISIKIKASNEEISSVFSEKTKQNIIDYLYIADNGINSMSYDIDGLVESSVNIGTVKITGDSIECLSLIRSSISSIYVDMLEKIKALAKLTGAHVEVESCCPEWQYNPQSSITRKFEEAYRRIYGNAPKLSVLHAGLECGIFDKNFGGEMDIISIGPNTYELHSPGEHVSILSIENTWRLILEVLKEI